MKILAIRIGDRYGPEYETYLESKLPEYEFIWIREPIRPDVTLQWNKMYGMSLDIDEPICVMDIDVILTNDYKKIFDYPIKPGEFLALPGWWRDGNPEYKINGGFFKYYPKDCKHIYDIFMKDVDKWQEHFIKNGITKGPVNGEQYFVEEHVRNSKNLKFPLVRVSFIELEDNKDEIEDFENYWSSKVDAINFQKLTDYKDKVIKVYICKKGPDADKKVEENY